MLKHSNSNACVFMLFVSLLIKLKRRNLLFLLYICLVEWRFTHCNRSQITHTQIQMYIYFVVYFFILWFNWFDWIFGHLFGICFANGTPVGCSHQRAWEYFIESIQRPNAFLATHCEPKSAPPTKSPHDINCDKNISAYMGYNADTR